MIRGGPLLIRGHPVQKLMGPLDALVDEPPCRFHNAGFIGSWAWETN